MNPVVASECEKCDGTGFMIVQRGGLSGATRCSCKGAPMWWRFRNYRTQKGSGRINGHWIHIMFTGPEKEVSAIAESQLGTRRFEIQRVGVQMPQRLNPTPYKFVGAIGLYMEKL